MEPKAKFSVLKSADILNSLPPNVIRITYNTPKKRYEEAIRLLSEAFCGTPSYAPEGMFDWIAFNVLRGPDSKPFTGPLTHPTPEKAIEAYEWLAGSTFKYTLEVGGVILATVDGDGDDATLASVCLAHPPNDAELFDFDKKLGIWGQIRYVWSLGLPPPPLRNKKFFGHGKALISIHNDVLKSNPHWYLMQIGTKPDQIGKGYGKMLLEILNQCADADNTSLYLETVGNDHAQLYERFGYEVKLRKPIMIGKPSLDFEGGVLAMVRLPNQSTVTDDSTVARS